MSASDWKQRPEGGNRLAIHMIGVVARHAGRGITRAFLYPITGYFLLVRGAERRASRAYLRRVFGRAPRLHEVARHMHTFAATVLDRVYMLGGRMRLFDIQLSGLQQLHAALDQRRGVLLFGSHLGSFDALRALARQRPDIMLRVVLDKTHNPAITEMLAALDPDLAAGIIDAGQDGLSVALAIKQAAEQGALVAMLVDRARPGEPAVTAPLLGAPALFPSTPWLIAATLRLPVVLAFGLYRGGNRYDLAFEAFDEVAQMPRGARAAALAALIPRYAARLEQRLRSAPYNWFNFYDFWHVDDPHRSAPLDSPRTADREHDHGAAGSGSRS